MLKMVQSDLALLEAETKTADMEVGREETADPCRREFRPAASSEEREDSFERWRRELRAQAGLDECDIDQSLRNVVRDNLAGTI